MSSNSEHQKSTGLHVGVAAPGVKKVDPILVIDSVKKSFGGLTAVDVNHLEIPRGAITALIGPNGAGKTTLFNLLTGFDTPDTGSWSFQGNQLAGVPSFKVAKMGQVRTFQLTKALSLLTVLENMKLGAIHQVGEKWWKGLLPFLWKSQEAKIEERADNLLKRFKMDHMRNEYAGTLSGGQRKLLEMARALMTEPTLVMLDEPMAGVNPALKQSLNEHIRGLRDDGMTVLFVEHDMDIVTRYADRVVAFYSGRVIADDRPEDVLGDEQVQRYVTGNAIRKAA